MALKMRSATIGDTLFPNFQKRLNGYFSEKLQ